MRAKIDLNIIADKNITASDRMQCIKDIHGLILKYVMPFRADIFCTTYIYK
jgi:hypothetical protein